MQVTASAATVKSDENGAVIIRNKTSKKKTRSVVAKTKDSKVKKNATPFSAISGNTTPRPLSNLAEGTTSYKDAVVKKCKLPIADATPKVANDKSLNTAPPPVFLENIGEWDQWLCRPVQKAQNDFSFVQQVDRTTSKTTAFACTLCGCTWAANKLHKKHLEGVRHKKTFNLYQDVYNFNQEDPVACTAMLDKIREQEDNIQSLGSEAQRRSVLVNFLRGVQKEKKSIERSWKSVEKRIQAYNKQQAKKIEAIKAEPTENAEQSNSLTTTSSAEVLVIEPTSEVKKEVTKQSSDTTTKPPEEPATNIELDFEAVYNKLEISVSKAENWSELALQDLSGDDHNNVIVLDSPAAATIPEEIETVESADVLVASPADCCCNMSTLSDLTMQSEVNWMDTIQEFEQQAKEMGGDDDLAILAYHAMDNINEQSRMETSATIIEAILREEDSFLFSPVSEAMEADKDFQNNVDSMHTEGGTEDDMRTPTDIVDAIEELLPEPVLEMNIVYSREVVEEGNHEHQLDADELERAEECVAALAFFGFP